MQAPARPRSDQGVLDRGAISSSTRWPRRIPAQYHRGMFGWRGEVREIIAQLEQQRSQLEQVRERARHRGDPERERLEAQATARLQEIEQRIADLRASLQ
jgi:hypothetical protein